MRDTMTEVLGLTFPTSAYEDGRNFVVTTYDEDMKPTITNVSTRAEIFNQLPQLPVKVIIIEGDNGYFRCIEF